MVSSTLMETTGMKTDMGAGAPTIAPDLESAGLGHNGGPELTKDDDKLDLLWGTPTIANFIGQTPTQTHYLLRTGRLPAKQIGGKWVAVRSKLVELFMGAT